MLRRVGMLFLSLILCRRRSYSFASKKDCECCSVWLKESLATRVRGDLSSMSVTFDMVEKAMSDKEEAVGFKTSFDKGKGAFRG